ncbi:hypothetical protein [Desulfurobacterium sp.]
MARRKGKSKKKPKDGKVLILVEGRSDKIFIERLLTELGIKKFFDVNDLSKTKGGTYILNKRKIKRKIEDAKTNGYSKVLIVLDLKTQDSKTTQYFECFPKLKSFYLREILSNQYSDYVKIIVAIKELECWELLAEKRLNTTNVNNCMEKLIKCLGWNWDPDKVDLAQHAVKKMQVILNNKHLNESFKYFLECLENSRPK